MDFFGIGPLELMLILILALVVFGPGKLPEIGAKLGSSLREMRKATREFSREIDETRQAIEGPINELKDPMQELAEPFQEAGTAIAGARETLANPSKAIEGYVMGQYASADKPAKTTADEPPLAHPAEPAEVLAADAVAADAVATDTAAESETVTASEVTTEAGATDAAAETDAVTGEATVDSVSIVAEPVAAEPAVAEPAVAEPAAETEVALAEAEPVEPIDSATTSGEIAVSPDPGVVSAIAAMESAFANTTPSSSENVESAGETAMAHKMPGATEASVVAADSEVAAPESPATTSPEPMAEATASDADSHAARCGGRRSGAATGSRAVDGGRAGRTGRCGTASSATGREHDVDLTAPPVATAAIAPPRKSANPSLQPPPGEGEAPSSDKPATQD